MRRIIKPVPGRGPVDPYNRPVPPEGAIVQWSAFWQRRLNEGAITFTEYPPKAPAPARKARKTFSKPTSTEDSEK